ncbi:ATP-binding cassette domain-containing protein [Bacillus sp. FJAT-27264]|uniref:ABC transporter ATP-binding protein n=1 Tax=Paenibacillus sp. (strain DSM 101736 / FJAT-27264) TaxID=1850362 RepID=UPI0009F6918C|nr:ATP-binding cassette domain-containing protein [Bacillus sp. FJAT-27264]
MNAIFQIHSLGKLNWSTDANVRSKYLFSQISAEITEPARIAMVGASGQGKSTLLRIMALLDTPDEGNLLVNGKSYQHIHARQWRMAVTYVAQQAVMLPGSIEDNLRTVSRLHGQPYDDSLATELLKQLGLDYLDLGKVAEDCSGGEKQRISLIRSLLLRPEILLLDEITASLDINSTQKVEALLLDWHKKEGTTFIWVTHDLEQARRISNRTWMMDKGGLHEYSSDSFFNEPVADLARRFVGPTEGSLQP